MVEINHNKMKRKRDKSHCYPIGDKYVPSYRFIHQKPKVNKNGNAYSEHRVQKYINGNNEEIIMSNALTRGMIYFYLCMHDEEFALLYEDKIVNKKKINEYFYYAKKTIDHNEMIKFAHDNKELINFDYFGKKGQFNRLV